MKLCASVAVYTSRIATAASYHTHAADADRMLRMGLARKRSGKGEWITGVYIVPAEETIRFGPTSIRGNVRGLMMRSHPTIRGVTRNKQAPGGKEWVPRQDMAHGGRAGGTHALVFGPGPRTSAIALKTEPAVSGYVRGFVRTYSDGVKVFVPSS